MSSPNPQEVHTPLPLVKSGFSLQADMIFGWKPKTDKVVYEVPIDCEMRQFEDLEEEGETVFEEKPLKDSKVLGLLGRGAVFRGEGEIEFDS